MQLRHDEVHELGLGAGEAGGGDDEAEQAGVTVRRMCSDVVNSFLGNAE